MYSCFKVKGILCFDLDCRKRNQCNPATDIDHARCAADDDTHTEKEVVTK